MRAKRLILKKPGCAIADILSGKKPAKPEIDPAELDLPLNVSFTIQIRNDARGPSNFTAVGYELYINNENLVVGNSSTVKQEGQDVYITVKNTFSTKKLSSAVKALFTEKKGNFRVTGSARIKLQDDISKELIPLGFDERGSFALK